MVVRLGLERAIPLLARITRHSAGLLELAPGKPVYAQVKSVVRRIEVFPSKAGRE